MINKKGELKLRNIMFMALVFSSIIIISSLLVIDMSEEYENTGMKTDYNDLGVNTRLGDDLFGQSNESISEMEANAKDSAGSIGSIIINAITGAGAVLTAVFNIPSFISSSFATIMIDVGIPGKVMIPISKLITLLLYVIVIFVIISALPTGGNKV